MIVIAACAALVAVGVADDTLDAYHELGVRAIRLDLFARRERPLRELTAYVRRMAARTEPRGWHLQFYSPGTVVRDLLPFLAELEATLVVDHTGELLNLLAAWAPHEAERHEILVASPERLFFA